jgi:hypothetical protein
MLSLVETGSALGQSAQLERKLVELTGLLEQECRLIDELRQALLRQRAGVAGDDSEVIETSVQAVGRTLLTLDEARRRRSELLGVITGQGDAPLAELEARLGRALPGALSRARESVRRAAEAAAREVAINQHILRRALEAGDAFLQQLFASATDPMPVYTPAARPAETRGSGLFLNRQA